VHGLECATCLISTKTKKKANVEVGFIAKSDWLALPRRPNEGEEKKKKGERGESDSVRGDVLGHSIDNRRV
jgi:hypothetical protein